MDCLFSDTEATETINYIRELKAKGYDPIIYAGPQWDVCRSSWTKLYIPWDDEEYTDLTRTENGIIGNYYGAPVYSFDGLDAHTCCVLPDLNQISFKP